jgi:hypothetical protein
MKHFAVLLTLLICSGGWRLEGAFGCDEGMIRDAAFDQPRDTYRLCVISRAGAAVGHDITGHLGSWLETTGATLNLEVGFLAADDPKVRWTDYGLPAAPPELPVVVLVGKRPANPHNIDARQDFYVDHWQPQPTPADLETLRASPARATLRRELARNLAVIVWVPGTSDSHPRINEMVDRFCQSGFGKQAWGVSSVTVDRHDPRERLLLSFLGTQPEGPDWVGVVFGRGKFMPPLEGEEITAAGIKSLLATVAADCTCTQSPARLGADLLMRWEVADDYAIVRLAPEQPDTNQEMAEQSLAAIALPQEDRWFGSPVARITLWLFGGLIVVSGIGSVAIFWHHAQRDLE